MLHTAELCHFILCCCAQSCYTPYTIQGQNDRGLLPVCVQELFLSSLLPDRKLKVLEQQPLQVRRQRGLAGHLGSPGAFIAP